MILFQILKHFELPIRDNLISRYYYFNFNIIINLK